MFALGKAAKAPGTVAWRDYRAAQDAAAEVATVLDIFVAQKAAPAADLETARSVIDELLDDLAPRARG